MPALHCDAARRIEANRGKLGTDFQTSLVKQIESRSHIFYINALSDSPQLGRLFIYIRPIRNALRFY